MSSLLIAKHLLKSLTPTGIWHASLRHTQIWTFTVIFVYYYIAEGECWMQKTTISYFWLCRQIRGYEDYFSHDRFQKAFYAQKWHTSTKMYRVAHFLLKKIFATTSHDLFPHIIKRYWRMLEVQICRAHKYSETF